MIAKLIHRQRRKTVANATKDSAFLLENGFASQYGQDSFVADFFEQKSGGTFVDIGANDGVTFSNTFYLERELGWSGVAVEPLTAAYGKLVGARTCKCIQGCVSDYEGTGQLLEIDGELEMLSGLVDRYSKRHLRRIERESAGSGGREAMQIKETPVISFNTIMQELNCKEIDFLSLDTEGGEFEILASIPFSDVSINVIAVENNDTTPRISRLLSSNGFQMVATAGCDEIYANESRAA